MKYQQPFGVSDPNAAYINGNPSTGTMGSIPPAAAIEHPMREIVNLIQGARMTPDVANLAQIAQAIQSGQIVYGDDTGTQNQYAVTVPTPVAAYQKGMIVVMKAARTNTGAATMKLNTLTAVPIVHAGDQTPLIMFDILQNSMQALAFDGTSFQLVWAQRQPGVPVNLHANTDYYVNNATGNDTNDGLGATVTGSGQGPWKTLQHAANFITNFNLNGFTITIHVADGTYAPVNLNTIAGSGKVLFVGNTAAPQNCSIISTTGQSCVVAASVGNAYEFNGFRLGATGTWIPGDPCSAFVITGSTQFVVNNIWLEICGGSHYSVSASATLAIGGTQHLMGGANGNPNNSGNHVFCENSIVTSGNSTPVYTIGALIGFGGPFIVATLFSYTSLVYASLTGAANSNGPRYEVEAFSLLNTNGGGEAYYPGTAGGIVGVAGIYQ